MKKEKNWYLEGNDNLLTEDPIIAHGRGENGPMEGDTPVVVDIQVQAVQWSGADNGAHCDKILQLYKQ